MHLELTDGEVTGMDMPFQVGHGTLESLNVGLDALELFHHALERRNVGLCLLALASSQI